MSADANAPHASARGPRLKFMFPLRARVRFEFLYFVCRLWQIFFVFESFFSTSDTRSPSGRLICEIFATVMRFIAIYGKTSMKLGNINAFSISIDSSFPRVGEKNFASM